MTLTRRVKSHKVVYITNVSALDLLQEPLVSIVLQGQLELRCKDVDLRSAIEGHSHKLGHVKVWPSLQQTKDVLLHQRLQATLCKSVVEGAIKVRNFLANLNFIEGYHHTKIF